MVEGEIARAVLDGAILAHEAVPQEDIEPREGDPIRRPHIFAQRNHRRQPDHGGWAADHLVVLRDHDMRSLDDGLDRILPAKQAEREIAERLEIRVEHERGAILEHENLLALMLMAEFPQCEFPTFALVVRVDRTPSSDRYERPAVPSGSGTVL